ncbi:MAG TPA: peroxidase [Candidatus Binatia bacterium]|jgi:deferrochelatase/peroxidase EfeB
MKKAEIDRGDVQGLVRFGYGWMEEACFFPLEVNDPAAARAWLQKISPAITTAEKPAELPATALHLAFTSAGLQALEVPQEIISQFSLEFVSGLTGEESRSRRLGDFASNAPSGWNWGGPGKTPHLLLMLYAKEGRLEERKKTLSVELAGAGFKLGQCLETSNLDGFEPFGFRDGISQPEIDWEQKRTLRVGKIEVEYGNLVATGEFILGYLNEYGEYTDRPLIDPQADIKNILLPAEDRPEKKDLGRNGTYMVFRQLRQDVRGFWRFLDRQADSNPEQRRNLAAAMVGRMMDGTRLVPKSERPIRGVGTDLDPEDSAQDIALNQFTYESDGAGLLCPYGAHVRRANPRNGDYPYGARGWFTRVKRIFGIGRKGNNRDDLIASTRFHRILRRGREYGTNLPLEQALRGVDTSADERGLHFICLNANIGRQFEFVQNAWMMGTKFDGLTEESDPLIGTRAPVPGCRLTDTFSMPQENGVRRRISGLPQFVTVRGGAYFFLPSIRALRYIASRQK